LAAGKAGFTSGNGGGLTASSAKWPAGSGNHSNRDVIILGGIFQTARAGIIQDSASSALPVSWESVMLNTDRGGPAAERLVRRTSLPHLTIDLWPTYGVPRMNL
jgi:hypothetical protein